MPHLLSAESEDVNLPYMYLFQDTLTQGKVIIKALYTLMSTYFKAIRIHFIVMVEFISLCLCYTVQLKQMIPTYLKQKTELLGEAFKFLDRIKFF